MSSLHSSPQPLSWLHRSQQDQEAQNLLPLPGRQSKYMQFLRPGKSLRIRNLLRIRKRQLAACSAQISVYTPKIENEASKALIGPLEAVKGCIDFGQVPLGAHCMVSGALNCVMTAVTAASACRQSCIREALHAGATSCRLQVNNQALWHKSSTGITWCHMICHS